MKTMYYFLIAISVSAASLLSSCTPYNYMVIQPSDRKSQMIIGQHVSILESAMGEAQTTKRNKNSNSVVYTWKQENRFTTQHYIPGRTYASSRYNYFTDSVHTTYTHIPGSSYTQNHHHWWSAEILAENNRITGINFDGNVTMGESTWFTQGYNKIVSDWLNAIAGDYSNKVKELVKAWPNLFTDESRLYEGAMQAAKYDASKVLVYYLDTFKLDLDKSCETWAKGEQYQYVLTKASLRDILRTRNNPKVRDALIDIDITL